MKITYSKLSASLFVHSQTIFVSMTKLVGHACFMISNESSVTLRLCLYFQSVYKQQNTNKSYVPRVMDFSLHSFNLIPVFLVII